MNIFKSTKKIIDLETREDGYEYFTDGLILPMYLPVKGSEEGDMLNLLKEHGTTIINGNFLKKIL